MLPVGAGGAHRDVSPGFGFAAGWDDSSRGGLGRSNVGSGYISSVTCEANGDNCDAPSRLVLDDVVDGMLLDHVDMQLIEMLRVDGRTSNRAMSAVVGLKEAAVAARLRSLIERRVLAVSALVDWEQAGYSWDLWLYLDVEGRPATDVAEELAVFENVAWVHMVFGVADIVAHVLLTDRAAAAEFLAGDIGRIDGVRNVRALVTLETVKFDVQFADLPLGTLPVRLPAPTVEVDDLDEQIMMAVVRDGRQSIRQVSRELGVSDSTVRVRLGRLEEAGVIRICAQVDPVRTNMLRAWAYVGVDVAGVDKREVCRALAAIPEVIVVALTSGTYDIVVLAAAGRRRRLLEVIATTMREIRGVYRTETSDIADVVKLDYRWARLSPSPVSLRIP